MFLTLICLLAALISSEVNGRAYLNEIPPHPNQDLIDRGHMSTSDAGYVKLSPVPFEVEAPGSLSPSSGGTQFEVLLAPSAPSNNFILHPTQQGSNQPYSSSGPYYIDSQGNLVQRPDAVKPLNFHEAPPAFPSLTDDELTILGQPLASHHTDSSNHPNDNAGEGPSDDLNAVVDQRPRPGISSVQIAGTSSASAPSSAGSSPYLLAPSPILPPSTPPSTSQDLSGVSLTVSPQPNSPQNIPAANQQQQQSTYSYPGYEPSQTVAARPCQTPGQQQLSTYSYPGPQPTQTVANQPCQTPEQQQLQTTSQVYHQQGAASAIPTATVVGHPSIAYKPRPSPTYIVPPPPRPSPIRYPGGQYIATVNKGVGQPSAVFTCLQNHLLDQAVLASGEYSPGPRGYSCKASRGRPFLSNHLLSANRQSPVSQPTVSKEPVPLPTVIPIHF